ncbi:hypothetical protein [Microbacterium oleivorans]|uniref:Signal peptidase I n=1 Tax=Microbacterium oleivorans TaxID=273677 RepID=A0A7D5F641_9MICO|nr:hypothetical protein [Microbacterium oleivorans]QLD12707.1 hypothetical protein HW566_13545 [Microbacterium oleivorans]
MHDTDRIDAKRIVPAAAATAGTDGVARDDRLATVAGITLILVVGWLIAAWVFDVSLHPVAAPSMSPAIVTGSLAVVQRVPAGDLEPGDVVFDPARDAPARVIGVMPSRDGGADVVVTLRGDGETDLPPHVLAIREMERIETTAPMLGWVALAVTTPIGGALGAMTVVTIVVVVVRRRRRHPPLGGARGTGGSSA